MIKGPLGLIVVSDTMNDKVCVKYTDLVLVSQEEQITKAESIKEAA
jgi:hypothetical protein